MDQFLQQYGFILMMGGLLVVMMIFSSRQRKKMMAAQAERERQLQEELKPGVWVKTAFGFWGRFVDMDGDVVVLETADGTETYWDRQVIREVGNPPFAEPEIASAVVEDEDGAEKILGLDADTDEHKN
ncbi:preprotein translocase subunit YajC [Schaalia suimastitidis]|uniref:preprotein translocase subunit YajC n=1 Tax=Schaalia suimastitidis TaxID=121163 RepID=UPI00041E9F78|nr:preprotein translocase subunit YajC [Schaalia suimastitidis]